MDAYEHLILLHRNLTELNIMLYNSVITIEYLIYKM